jgi:DNA recombination protein RmuC
MMEILSGLSLIVAVIILIVLLRRKEAPAADMTPVQVRLEVLEKGLERLERALREESSKGREEAAAQARALREEVAGRQDALRGVVDQRLKSLQEENSAKLDQMRQTVDEKLQGTLEKRLGESFKLVSERLEAVHKGLGEMQNLAAGVGDLKKVLTNVKTRGTWGEVQLGNLLEQMLTADQFERNVATTGTSERVEFAIKLPGAADSDEPVWLPIDAKFPVEDYQRLVEAAEAGDAGGVEAWGKEVEKRVRECARYISAKYVEPPRTTDFAILFLATEGLYAEVLRRPGLAENLQQQYRVTIAGPTTLCALLNSLQMGFRTLAIHKQSSAVWELLGAVKTEFGKYGEVLDKLKKKLDEASNTVDRAATRSRAIERKLREVESLPSSKAEEVLGSPEIQEVV